MHKQTLKKTTIYNFDSVLDYVNWINTSPFNPVFTTHASVDGSSDFTGTKSYDEAMDLLLHGWTPAAKELTQKLRGLEYANTKKSSRMTYDVVGACASVPRYIQGIPTNMINRKPITVREKVITITKDVCYAAYVKAEDIMEEGLRTLQIVSALEATGARVRLNVIIGASDDDHSANNTNIYFKVCVKRPDQRWNISSMAFPLAHVSFLRRIFFRAMEVAPETTRAFVYGYGHPSSMNYDKSIQRFQSLCKGEHFIKNFIGTTPEQFVKNFSKSALLL